MSQKPRILFCPSDNEDDLDHHFMFPEARSDKEAQAKAEEVHRAYQESPDPQDWDGFISAMEAVGFIYPEFLAGPSWDEAPGDEPPSSMEE